MNAKKLTNLFLMMTLATGCAFASTPSKKVNANNAKSQAEFQLVREREGRDDRGRGGHGGDDRRNDDRGRGGHGQDDGKGHRQMNIFHSVLPI